MLMLLLMVALYIGCSVAVDAAAGTGQLLGVREGGSHALKLGDGLAALDALNDVPATKRVSSTVVRSIVVHPLVEDLYCTRIWVTYNRQVNCVYLEDLFLGMQVNWTFLWA